MRVTRNDIFTANENIKLLIERFNYSNLHSRDATGNESEKSEVLKIAKSVSSGEDRSQAGESRKIDLAQGRSEMSLDSVDENLLIWRIDKRKKRLLAVQIMWIFMVSVSLALMVLQVVLFFKGPSLKE